jgi:hypothetical protein
MAPRIAGGPAQVSTVVGIRQRTDHAAYKRVPSWFRPSRSQRNPKTSFDRYGRRPHALAARGIPSMEVLTDLNTLLDNVAAAAPLTT